jgi:hypothetical protein
MFSLGVGATVWAMSGTNDHATASYSAPEKAPIAAAIGFIVFAGVMLVMAGFFQAFAGLVALVKDEFYVRTPNYVLELDPTTWGWIHLVMGLLVLGAGFALLAGNLYGRMVGVAFAALSAIANFAFIPYYPFWSLTVIAIDVFVIWAITVHGGRLHE